MKSIITGNATAFLYSPKAFPLGVRIGINEHVTSYFPLDYSSDSFQAAALTAGTLDNQVRFDLDLGDQDAARNLGLVEQIKDDVRLFVKFDDQKCFLFEAAKIERTRGVFSIVARKVFPISEDYFNQYTGIHDDSIDYEAQMAAHFAMDRIFNAARTSRAA